MSILSKPLPKLVLETTQPAIILDKSKKLIWTDEQDGICVYSYKLKEEYCMDLPNLANYIFTNRFDEVKAFLYPNANYDLVVDAYYRSVLPMILQIIGTQSLHASGVLTSAGVVALCAPSGTGKTTLAFGLSQRKYSLWADDMVSFELIQEKIQSLFIPFRNKLRKSAASFFQVEYSRQLNYYIPDKIEQTQPLLAIFVLKRVEEELVKITPLKGSQSFSSVFPNAYIFDIDDIQLKQQAIESYLTLIEKVPTFELSFQGVPENIWPIVDKIEQTIEEFLC